MIVEVLHPAALLYLGPGSRRPRLGLAACRTQAELVEVPEDAVAPIPEAGIRSLACIRPRLDGIAGSGPGPWVRLEDGTGEPVTARRLAAALAAPEGVRNRALRAGTPLMAWGHPDSANVAAPDAWTSRGEEIAPAALRRIERDDREVAAEAVRRHLAEAYRIVGDAVMVRHGFLARGYHAGTFEADLGAWRDEPRAHHPTEIVAGGADYAAALAYASQGGRIRSAGTETVRDWAAAARDWDAGMGATVAANSLPAELRRIVRRCMRRQAGWGEADAAERLRAAGEALLPLEIDGLTGLYGRSPGRDAAAALRLVRDTAVTVAGIASGRYSQEARDYDNDLGHALAMARGIDGFYLPSIPVPAPPAEDAAALASLGA